jgi:hypothetical protein
MTRIIWLAILSLTLYGCGGDSEDSSSADWEDDDESEWAEDGDETVETGSFAVNLPGDHGSGEAMCSLNLTRAVDKRLASIILTLDVIARGCDGMGNCSNPGMRSGEFNYSGGIDGDQPFATMILNYEPPTDSEEILLWMYNVLYKSAPTSRFDMHVDGESFNVLTSDIRDADDFSKGPHIWNTTFEIEADMLQSSDAGDQSSPGLQTVGEFSYEGPCEIYAQYIQL